ncbi:hypothetical protein EMCRGX_G012055 [Ephydatia muelleri]
MKAKNSKTISSIILSPTTQVSKQAPGLELPLHLQPVEPDSCSDTKGYQAYQSTHFNIATSPSPTHPIDNLEATLYDIISMSSTRKSTDSTSHYNALERPFSPLPSFCESNAQWEQISSYAVLESPCKPSAGCTAEGSGTNVYFELELQPNIYDTVAPNESPQQISPYERNEPSNCVSIPSSGTNI